METLDHANSVWLHFFHLQPYTEGETKPSENCTLFALADGVTPLPLGNSQLCGCR